MDEGEQKSSGGSPLIAIALALLVAGGGGTYYFYSQYQKSQQELTQLRESADLPQVDVDALVGEVGELMELPPEETPTVATIRDTENLADHPFLSKGQEGDRLLIYTGEKLVIMYRPNTGKIVAVGTVTIQQTEEGAEGAEGTEGTEGEVPVPEEQPAEQPTEDEQSAEGQ